MFIRLKKTSDGRRYYYVVETIQTGDGKSRQRVVKYLGTVGNILSVFEEYEGERDGHA